MLVMLFKIDILVSIVFPHSDYTTSMRFGIFTKMA